MPDPDMACGVSTDLVARGAPNSNALINRYLEELGKSQPSVVVLTASQTNEPSFEGKQWGGGHGVFTHFLLEGLGGKGDRNGNGVVSLQEMIDYSADNVKRETNYRQHPTAMMSTTWDRDLPMAVVPES